MLLFGKLKSWDKEENGVTIHFDKRDVKVTVISDSIFNFFSQFEQTSVSTAIVNDVAIVLTKWDISEDEDSIHIKTKKLLLKIYDDFYTEIYTSNGSVVCKDYHGNRQTLSHGCVGSPDFTNAEGHLVFNQEKSEAYSIVKTMQGDEAFYGLGDKPGFLNKRGYDYDMWNTDEPKPHVDFFKRLYKSVPFCIVHRKDSSFGLFFDNVCRAHFDLGKESDKYYFYSAAQGNLNYYFIFGKSMVEVVKGYAYLTGTSPLPQKWTLGYHQSRWGYKSERDVVEIADKMRVSGVPCDSIHLDIDYMNAYKVFTFDKNRFRNLKKLTSTLSGKGFKLVTIIDPGVKKESGYFAYEEGVKFDYFAKTPDGQIYENEVWPGNSVFPDFGKEKVRNWWADKQKILIDVGIRGVWNDMNEPSTFNGDIPDDIVFSNENNRTDHAHIHNVYGHNMCRATYEGLKKYDGKRPFVLTRAAYSGTQKYAAVWSGDNYSIWAHLQMAIPQLCNLGLSGFAYAGTDIGGFCADTTKELLIRWVQLGAFSPFMRNHSVQGSRRQEPWEFDKETLDIYRGAVKLRYKLIPYFYDLFFLEEKCGLPIMRPLVLHYERDEIARECNSEFLVGENLLVAPVVEQGARVKSVYLPQGNWFDYYTGEKFVGKQWILRDAPLELCPLFVKSGSILPIYSEQNYIGEKDEDSVLRIEVFPGEGEWEHMQDNGENFAYQNGEFNLYYIQQKNNQIRIKLIHHGYQKRYREVVIYYLGREIFEPLETSDKIIYLID